MLKILFAESRDTVHKVAWRLSILKLYF